MIISFPPPPHAHQNPQAGSSLKRLADQQAPQIDVQPELWNQCVDGKEADSASGQIEEKGVERHTQSVENAAECSGQKQKRTDKAETDNVGARQFISEQKASDQVSEEQKCEGTAKT